MSNAMLPQPRTTGYNYSNEQGRFLFDANRNISLDPNVTDYSMKEMADFDAYKNSMGPDYMGYAKMGLGAIDAGLGIASYFDNRKVNKKKMEVMDQNMKHASMARADRTSFLQGTKSAFA